MELREPIEDINRKLLDEYGVEMHAAGEPKFRVVFSEDQYERRLTEFTDEGFQLLHPEVRLLPKYKQWINQKYVLERLVPVADGSDLVTKVSYEPAWVFQDKHGNYLPPFFEGCRHVIESLMSKIEGSNTFTRYKDKNVPPEERLAEIQKVEDQLFGNESNVTDHLAAGTGIVIPGNDTIN